MVAIEARNVVKAFGDFTALNSISLTIARGEFVAITGKSGSGKSTLFYSLSGLDSINNGTVMMLGYAIHSLPEDEVHRIRNTKMGFVFQFHYLISELTALENILMPAKKIKMHKEKMQYAQYLLDYFDIKHCKDKLPSQMSGGERQRVAVARALIMNPDIIFADEPTGNLDSINSEAVMRIFKEVNKQNGTTVILITHDDEYAHMAGRQIHLKDGQIEYDIYNK
ncbi:MAG TPA: ABC transporter ATP-binding protein [Spirochaetota bacterium]|nr:ABC transporter ATP-binding protein [Spirochaetota bacterium]HOM88286.1 ABC transporter ATP-binding protein [Spirochaetota bacterium]HOR93397.1 ABC transporter ATP-binding protein [Spirochaetota bacterium]HOT19420.1 ABC transporter ATP-binding protein [Spirochaetota bacterium]HPK45344.1 ABC transporter ATP-binding protein [Spirochaetota bacterium]